jgi:nicotianamine synthase
MSFIRADVSAADGESEKIRWTDFDVVFLAALVGMDTSSKLYILQSLAKNLKPGALVVARSAKGLRSVLYPVSRSCSVYVQSMRTMLTQIDS